MKIYHNTSTIKTSNLCHMIFIVKEKGKERGKEYIYIYIKREREKGD